MLNKIGRVNNNNSSSSTKETNIGNQIIETNQPHKIGFEQHKQI